MHAKSHSKRHVRISLPPCRPSGFCNYGIRNRQTYAVCGLRSAVCGLRSAVCGLRSDKLCGLFFHLSTYFPSWSFFFHIRRFHKICSDYIIFTAAFQPPVVLLHCPTLFKIYCSSLFRDEILKICQKIVHWALFAKTKIFIDYE